jgi:hypothetical protein
MAVSGAIVGYDCEGTLTLGGVVYNTAAYAVTGLYQLWGGQIDYRTGLRTVPYVQGQVAYPSWRNALRVSLPLLISGHVTTAGVATSLDKMRQLYTHHATLLVQAQAPDPTTTVTRTLTITTPTGATLTASGGCVPLGIVPGTVELYVMRATLELLIPAGIMA